MISGSGDSNVRGFVFIDEHASEVVDAEEVIESIIGGFPHFALFDHFEDDMAEVVCGMHAPFAKNDRAEHTELLQPQKSDAFEEFSTGDVPGFFGVLVATELFLDESQGGEDEFVGTGMIGACGTAAERCHGPQTLVEGGDNRIRCATSLRHTK